MPWIEPPPDVRRRVENWLGPSVWHDLAAAWSASLGVDPNARLTRWYATPAETRAEYVRNPRAAWLSAHGAGLAVDVTPTEARRADLMRVLRERGFSVREYRGTRAIHVQAVTPERWARSPVIAWLRGQMGPRPPRFGRGR